MASERQLDSVLDSVYTLYDGSVSPVPPIVKVPRGAGLCPDVVFGLDTALFAEVSDSDGVLVDSEHHAREVDIIQVVRNLSGKVERKECGVDGCEERGVSKHKHDHGHGEEHDHDGHHQKEETKDAVATPGPITKEAFDTWLADVPKDDVYRVKGLVRFPTGLQILNWAFGTWDYTPVPESATSAGQWDDVICKITVMGRGLSLHLKSVVEAFGAGNGEAWLVPAEVD